MKNLVFSICLIGILLASSVNAYGAKTYKKHSADNIHKRIGEVQVEESELITKTTILTPDLINTKIDQLTNKISDLQSELINWQAIKVKVDAEAKKVILNTDP